MTKVMVGLFLALVAMGCESGQEETGVGSATATRRTDGIVVVDVKTTCDLVEGMGRLDGNCDSDGEDACFHADWVDRANHANIITSARRCLKIGHAYHDGLTMQSPIAVAADHDTDIVLYTDGTGSVTDGTGKAEYVITIASPTN